MQIIQARKLDVLPEDDIVALVSRVTNPKNRLIISQSHVEQLSRLWHRGITETRDIIRQLIDNIYS